MEIIYLTKSHQRSTGAMHESGLRDKILVFVYPRMSRRLFHTFFCEPLRIVGLDDAGKIVYDQVKGPNTLVAIPACRLVLEMDPGTDFLPYKDDILTRALQSRTENRHLGGVGNQVRIDTLFFSLLADAALDVQRIGRVGTDPDKIRKKFKAWERGQIASSAGFILDFRSEYDIPKDLINLSQDFLRNEAACLDELHAASIAGVPWVDEFPQVCMRCGRIASWRQVISPPDSMPAESAWRYARPENHVPLCFRCSDTLGFNKDQAIRFELVWGLWGMRFEAFWRWHQAHVEGFPPEWDKHAYPLWPPHYGESRWETGSGSFEHAGPRPPIGISRNSHHARAISRRLGADRNRYKNHAPVPYLVSSRVQSSIGGVK